MPFKVGDTVQLKSGGPRMTVVNIGTHGGKPGVQCNWFEKTEVKGEVFPLEALKESPDPQPTKVVR